MIDILAIGEALKFRKLEELLLSLDFSISFRPNAPVGLESINEVEREYQAILLLRDAFESEIPWLSMLKKSRFTVATIDFRAIEKIRMGEHWLEINADESRVVDEKGRDVLKLSSAQMKGNPVLYRGVEEITIARGFHIEAKGREVILNGVNGVKALVGDIAIRSGRDVILGVMNENTAIFSCDVFSDDVITKDNVRFLTNLLNFRLTGSIVLE
jgi:hypothetical protein